MDEFNLCDPRVFQIYFNTLPRTLPFFGIVDMYVNYNTMI